MRSWSVSYALRLFSTSYLGVTQRNWLEKQFQNGVLDRRYEGQRLATKCGPRPEGPLIWIHVHGSEGALGISSFAFEMSRAHRARILLTSDLDLSEQLIRKRLPEGVIYQRAPLNLRSVMRRFLDHWRPAILIWVSDKASFRVLHETMGAGIPTCWVNLRISAQKRRRMLWARRYHRTILRRFDLILCQDKTTMKMVRSFGVRKGAVHVVGSFVSGTTIPDDARSTRARWSTLLKDRQIWLAAHVPPGELNLVYDTFLKARRQSHRLLMVLQSTSSRPDGLRGSQLYISDKAKPSNYEREFDVMIVRKKDLGMWYRLAPVTYLGGNLSEDDSPNPFEPASLGSAILTGPSWTRYRDLYERLDQREALEVVAGAQSLTRSLVQTLAPDRAALLAHAAWDVSTEGAAVADRATALVMDLLPNDTRHDEAA